jgi:predicted DNA-binding WGR domain protein
MALRFSWVGRMTAMTRTTAVHLHRIDPARNMRRFYALDVQPDLFGGFTVVKEWGRIGARGRMMDELHATEALAVAAMQRQADRKRRRGYALSETGRCSNVGAATISRLPP